MQIIAPYSSFCIDFINPSLSQSVYQATAVYFEDSQDWNIAVVQDDQEFTDKTALFLKKNTNWIGVFKAFEKVIEQLTTDGYAIVEQQYTMPLFMQEGSSDKEYHVYFQPSKTSPGTWNSSALYGRRGSSLKPVEIAQNTTPAAAWAGWRAKAGSKVSDGYQLYVKGVVYQNKQDKVKVNDPILLLTDTQDTKYIYDDSYAMQEKFDGERRPVVYKNSEQICATNKTGFEVSFNIELEKALIALIGNNSARFDCEDLGSKLAIFDITRYNGQDLTGMAFSERYNILANLFNQSAVISADKLVLAKAFFTTEEKKQAFDAMKERHAEGVVFKDNSAAYGSGKIAGYYKFKFYAEATVVVLAKNDKRSVQMGVYQKDGTLISVGNVTIPANQDVPEVGQCIEVRYLYAYPGGSLFLPTYKGLRPDQTPQDCTVEKLKFKAQID